VLAGPFAAYQLAVLGADVIKVEHPDEADQTRNSGTDHGLNRHGMGTSYLTQGSNKRSITLPAVLTDILKTRTAAEWEAFFQARHVPAARVRNMAEAVRDPQFAARRITHHHDRAPGIEGGFDVPLAAFTFAHGGPSIETPPPVFGADTDIVLAEHGYTPHQISKFRHTGVI
jgi:crotonobetainyl-CoA:carnitine CoA-transferase CaiB-like acyl-CoA transferase